MSETSVVSVHACDVMIDYIDKYLIFNALAFSDEALYMFSIIIIIIIIIIVKLCELNCIKMFHDFPCVGVKNEIFIYINIS